MLDSRNDAYCVEWEHTKTPMDITRNWQCESVDFILNVIFTPMFGGSLKKVKHHSANVQSIQTPLRVKEKSSGSVRVSS